MLSMFKSILIPTDFSPAAWNAVQIGLMLGETYKARVSVLHVYPVSSPGLTVNGNRTESLVKTLSNVRSKMDKITNGLTEKSKINIENVVVSGNVKEQLEEFVSHHNFDLVIMGLNGTGSDESPGSHTSGMIKGSNRPVLVVPSNYVKE